MTCPAVHPLQRAPHAVDPNTGAFTRYGGITTIDWLPQHAVIDFIHLTNHFWHHNVMTEVAVPQVGSLFMSCHPLALYFLGLQGPR